MRQQQVSNQAVRRAIQPEAALGFDFDSAGDAVRVAGSVVVGVVTCRRFRHDHKRRIPHSCAAERARVLRPTSAGGPLTFKQIG